MALLYENRKVQADEKNPNFSEIFLQNFVSFGFKKPRSDIFARIADVFGNVCHLIK